MKLKCPNCGDPVAQANEGCLLHDLIQVVRERGTVPKRKLRKIHGDCDVDRLWDDLGRIVDRLEEGDY